MRKIIAKFLYFLLFYKVKSLSKRSDCILSIYGHDQQKEPFEKLIKWLFDNGYSFVDTQELYQIITKQIKVEKKCVWLSFDDGWKSNYDDIFPVLQKYNIPATVFVATKGIEDGYFWFNKAFQNRNSNLFNKVGDLWKIPNRERVSIVSKLPSYTGERVTMNVSELHIMAKSGLIYFGNHTHDHVISDQCSEKELINEVSECSKRILDYTGQGKHTFIYSYPNGDFDNKSIDIIRKLGFKMAVTTKIGNIYPGDNVYRLKRNEFKNGCIEENLLQIFGLWTPIFNVIKKILFIRDEK